MGCGLPAGGWPRIWKERDWKISDEEIWGHGRQTQLSEWANITKMRASPVSARQKVTSAEEEFNNRVGRLNHQIGVSFPSHPCRHPVGSRTKRPWWRAWEPGMDSATRTSTRQGRAGCYRAERRGPRGGVHRRAPDAAPFPGRPASCRSCPRWRAGRTGSCFAPTGADAPGTGLHATPRPARRPPRAGRLREPASQPKRRSNRLVRTACAGLALFLPPRSGWLDLGVERPFEDLGAAQLGDIALRGRRLHSVRCERHPASGAASPGARIHGCRNQGVEMGGHRWLSPLVTH